MKLKIAFSSLALAALIGPALGQTWTEVGDAGELVSAHQDTPGTGALTKIVGSLDFPFDLVDLYCITIDDPLTFSATSSTGDTPLWIFKQDGTGLSSQEGFYLFSPSVVTGAFVGGAGNYLLGISRHDLIPEDALMQDMWTSAPRSTEIGPNGPGASGLLTSWFSGGASALGAGGYTITLTGASYGNCTVPEPGTAIALAILVLPAFRRRR